MSLIFLQPVEDPFTARDLAGRALPFSTLDFFDAGTSAPADVGDDDGHFEADADGIFEAITLETGIAYRVVHKTADGVLVYDVDPYLCDCDDIAPQFRSPIQRARFANGRIAPGAELHSFEPDGTTPLNLYADAALERPLSNPVRANAAGIFGPMYADDAFAYVLTLLDADGNLLEEFDPYVCACGPSVVVDPIAYLEATTFTSSTTHTASVNFGIIDEQNLGIVAQVAMTNGNTLVNRTAFTYRVLLDGVEIAAGNLSSQQVSFIEVTANTARFYEAVGAGGAGDLEVEVTATFSNSALRRVQLIVGLFANCNQADFASLFDSDSSFDTADPLGGPTLTVTPDDAGDLVFTMAAEALNATMTVIAPTDFTMADELTGASFRFRAGHRVETAVAPVVIDWTTARALGGHDIFAGVIRHA